MESGDGCVGAPIEIVNNRLKMLLSASEAMRCARGRAAHDRLDFLAASRFFLTSLLDAVADSFKDDNNRQEGDEEEGADEATVVPQYFTLSLDEDIDPRLVAAAHVLSMTVVEWVAVRRRGGTDASHAEENKCDADDPSTCIAHEVLLSCTCLLLHKHVCLRVCRFLGVSTHNLSVWEGKSKQYSEEKKTEYEEEEPFRYWSSKTQVAFCEYIVVNFDHLTFTSNPDALTESDAKRVPTLYLGSCSL